MKKNIISFTLCGGEPAFLVLRSTTVVGFENAGSMEGVRLLLDGSVSKREVDVAESESQVLFLLYCAEHGGDEPPEGFGGDGTWLTPFHFKARDAWCCWPKQPAAET